MPSDTGNVDNCPAALLAHDVNRGLHGGDNAEEIRFEHLVACAHIHLRNRIEQAMSGIVDPNINALKMMQGERDDAVDFFRVANITGESDGAFSMSDAVASGLGARSITREQNHICSLIDEKLGDSFADTHGSPGDNDDFPLQFHARVVCAGARQVKMANLPRRTIERRKSFLGDEVTLLPLFPLDIVLFPGTDLPLHIFEPRYKEMIAECLANKLEFGVIRALEQGIAEIGCTVEITKITKEYSDGRLDLIAHGRQRFEVLRLDRERSFLRGEILLIPDEPADTTSVEKERAIQAHKEILSLAGATPNAFSAEQGTLSFQLAGSLPLDLDFKQKLLSTLSERERIHELATYLEGILPGLRRAARAREKAGGNGHAR